MREQPKFCGFCGRRLLPYVDDYARTLGVLHLRCPKRRWWIWGHGSHDDHRVGYVDCSYVYDRYTGVKVL